MSRTILAAALVLLAGCGGAADEPAPPPDETPTATGAPNLALCPKAAPVEDGLRRRTGPIAVPAAFRALVASDMDHFAVSTIEGGTVCVDTAWMENIEEIAVSTDRRFFSFGWNGYEAFGHVVVDRAGKGASFDAGTTPAFSPDGKHIAAADIDESGYGALGGFAVWEVTADSTRQIAKFPMDGSRGRWSAASWRGNGCVDVEVQEYEHLGADGAVVPERTVHWRAAPAAHWEPQPGSCPAA